MSERPCFFSKPITPREKGCKNEAKWRVILGRGFFIDVCDEHVEGYKGLGYKIVPLEGVETET